ncbi:hypothetical protein [Parasphingorhabdus sp.]|uniref:hypothetical protein n=1 Tax=Parasphingorhabdus sp. TaxID=2709688 RepID=UPI003297E24B
MTQSPSVSDIQDIWSNFDQTPEYEMMKRESAGQFFEDFSIAICNGWKLQADDLDPDGAAMLVHDDHAFRFPASQPAAALELIGITTPDDKANALMAARAGLPAPAKPKDPEADIWAVKEGSEWDVKPDPDQVMQNTFDDDDIFGSPR